MAYDNKFWEDYYSKKMDAYLRRYSEKQFTERLLYIMKKNHIRKIDISRALGVNEQTVRNWFDTKNGYQPQWLTYIFKLFIFLGSRCKGFNIMHLFLIEYDENELENREKTMQKINKKVTHLKNNDIWFLYEQVLSSFVIEHQLLQLKELKELSKVKGNDKYYEIQQSKRKCKDMILDEISDFLKFI